MAGTDLSEKYYVKRNANDEWEDVTEKFDGVKILSLDGFNELGDSVNVYNEQWIESQEEDFLISGSSGQIVRKNIDLSLTFICGERYGALDTQSCHDAFVEWLTKYGDFYVKSKYMGMEAHVVCLKSYKPTTQKLKRGIDDSYIIGTISLHTLDAPTGSDVHIGDVYIGFGNATLSNVSTLLNVQHYERSDAGGNYTIACPSLSYLWICVSGTIDGAESSGFAIPMESATTVSGLHCYRSSANIIAHTMNFTVLT